MPETRTHYRACHLCEAICGLEIKTRGEEIISIKGDPNDPFSRGHICPKAVAIQDIHNDPDRLRKPVKKVNGQWQEIGWEQALDEVARKLADIQLAHGNNAVGIFAGNPNVHNYGNITHAAVIRKAIATQNGFSATSLDQLPHHFASYHMYGHQFLIPVPDIDHTDYMLILGGNPLASNGSMMTVPDVKKRLQAIMQRDGEVVVIDPRRTETAAIATRHHFIKPGSDAYLLMAILHVMFYRGWVDAGHLATLLDDVDEVRELVQQFSPELAEKRTGIPVETIVEMTQRMVETPRAVCYGRMGVSVQEHGALCQWAIQLINLFAGNLDVKGGALVPNSAAGYVKPGERGAGHFNRFQSRVSGLPEFGGELPATVMAEEMLTPGEGQIRAMLTLAGNPVLSAPSGQQLDEAFDGLEFMVSMDIYINETTRHADYILPPTSALEHDHYDFAFHRLAVRNTARFNEPVFEPEPGALHDWEIINRLSQKLGEYKGIEVKTFPAPSVIVDQSLQYGPYGKYSEQGQSNAEDKLDLLLLRNHPHGIDLGPLKPSLPERICTADKKIRLLWPEVVAEVKRLANRTETLKQNELLLIGRRHVRSNNSWMHNSHRLVKGKPRWRCLMNTEDMQARKLVDGDRIVITSRAGEVQTEVEQSDEVMHGVVCLPHGWGHTREGVQLSIASKQQGVSINDLTDATVYDKLSGNAALNAVPVTIRAAS
ncbi:MAG: molybdopterin-dependent oxidoreductase [Pseudomonadales bacterium]|nr:molybdopterin-dependent oxidoreductase [Pseudomonadales bacterium]